MNWSETDLAYLAGLIDGEGFLLFHADKQLKYLPRVGIKMTNKEIIYWLQSMFGGKISYVKSKNPKHNDSWMWLVQRRKDIRSILSVTLPYLKVKHLKATLMLTFINDLSYDKSPGGKGYPEEIHKQRNELVNLFNSYQRRGTCSI